MVAFLPDLSSWWPTTGVVAAAMLLVVLAGRLGWERRRLLAQNQQLESAHERLSDDLWELRAAVEARGKAEAASEAKSRFLTTVSHEIRTPLNGILGMADLLSATPLNREQQAFLAVVKTSGTTLTTMIDEILDFSRIESGRLDLAPEPFDLASLIESVVELISPRAQDKGLEIAAWIGRDLPAMVVGDALRLRQVLTNLAGNAVKFTDAGGVGVSVTAAPGGALRFSVADTGPGVPIDRRAAIFEEFEQADGSTTRRHGGTGLGLAIAKRIIAHMGGDLVLEDRAGGGSVFFFVIKLPPAGEARAAAQVPWPQLEGKRALIVSPGVFQAGFLHEQLRDCGATTALAKTVAEATALLRREPQRFDLMFADCALGEPATRSLAVAAQAFGVRRAMLMFSPNERRGFGQQLASGFDGWLVKPVRWLSLAERLDEQAPAGDAQPPTARVTRMPANSRSSLRVLLAEDNPVNALIAETSLQRCGATVTHAIDGNVALERFVAALGDAHPFDLVLMDICMPGLDGFEVTRRIRALEGQRGLRPTRIVAMTAHALEATLNECRQVGMDEALTKPINPQAFRRLVEPQGRDLTLRHGERPLSGAPKSRPIH